MAKKAKNEAFETSTDAFRFWSENALSSMKSFSDMFKFGEQDNADQMNEAFTKNIRSYMKMYDSSAKGMLEFARKSFEAGRKSLAGEEMQIDVWFETIDKSREDAAAYMTDILSDTPFEGMKEIDKAIRQSVDSFSDEQKSIRAFVREICDLNAKLAKLSMTAVKESANPVNAIKEDGTVATDAYKKLVNEYGDTFKKAFEKIEVPEALKSGYRERIDHSVNLANKNLELAAAWVEINLKAAKAAGKTMSETAMGAEKPFAFGEKEAWEDIYNSWKDVYEKTIRNFVESAQYDTSIPKFIGELAGYAKFTGEQFKKAMAIPTYAKEEDLKKISEELAEIKKVSAKSAE
jgi:hypothetical protein